MDMGRREGNLTQISDIQADDAHRCRRGGRIHATDACWKHTGILVGDDGHAKGKNDSSLTLTYRGDYVAEGIQLELSPYSIILNFKTSYKEPIVSSFICISQITITAEFSF